MIGYQVVGERLWFVVGGQYTDDRDRKVPDVNLGGFLSNASDLNIIDLN